MIIRWILLLALTMLSFAIGRNFIGSAETLVRATVMSIALAKVRIIALDFMELRHAPIRLRAGVEGWIWLTWIVLSAILIVPIGQ